MVTSFSLEVDALLEAYLPHFADSRRRWPLWTYERRMPPELPEPVAELRAPTKTWYMSESWADRLRFSPHELMLEVFAEAHPGTRGVGVTALWPSEGTLTTIRAGGSETEAIAPQLHARIAAIYAATAYPAVSSDVGRITLPVRWWWTDLIDDRDSEELSDRLICILLGKVDTSDRPLRFARPLLMRFVRLGIYAGKRPGKRHGGPEDVTDEANTLAGELCREAGLLPDRSGGRRNVLSRAVLRQLNREAKQIVKEIGSWKPNSEQLASVSAVLGADQPNEVDEDQLSNREWAAYRRTSELPGRPKAEDVALWMRFAFLTRDEIDLARESRTVKGAARALVRGRLTADLSERRYQNLLSEGRTTA